MAESQKKNSSDDRSKEKNSFLDLDIGKDFLGSWKSMSMAEGDVDFDFTPAPKGNKKEFDFSKADMDFNLDGDFGKMSSFDMDMPDLDISPPLKKDGQSRNMSDMDISPSLKKDGQSKAKPKESSGGKNEDKTKRFAFEFDFELEDFNLECCLTKEGSKAQSDKSKKESFLNGTGSQNKEGPAPVNLDTSPSENESEKPSLPGTVNAFDMGCLLGGSADVKRTSLGEFDFESCLTKEDSKAQSDESKKESFQNGTGHQDKVGPAPVNLDTSPLESESENPSLTGTVHTSDMDCLLGGCAAAKRTSLGEFDFESCLTKEVSKVQSDKSKNDISQNGTGHQDKVPTPMNFDMSTLENEAEKPSLPETVITFDMDCLPGGTADANCTRNGANDVSTSEHLVVTEEVASDRSKSHPETAMASMELPDISPSEQLVSPEPFDREAITRNDALQDLPPDNRRNTEQSGGNSSGAQQKVDSKNMAPIASNGEEDVNVRPITGSTCNYEHTMSGNSCHFTTVTISDKNDGRKSQVKVDNQVTDKRERTEQGQINPPVETSRTTTSSVSGIPCDTPSGREKLKPASEILKLPLVNQPADPPHKETENGSEAPITCSKYFIQSEKPECAVQKASILKTFSSLSSKTMGLNQLSLAEGRRDSSIQSDRKLVSLPFQNSKTLLRGELPRIQSQNSCKGLKICGEAANTDGLQSRKILNDSSITQNKDMVKEKSDVMKREKSMKDLDTLSSCAAIPSFSMETNKQAEQNHGDTTTLTSMKITPPEEHKLSSIEGGRKTPDLLKLSGLNRNPSKPAVRRDIKPVGNFGQNSTLLRKSPLSIVPDTQKQKLSTLSMKRKVLEEDSRDVVVLNPSKRLSRLPIAIRNSAETTESILDKKVSRSKHNKMQGDHVKSTTGNSPTFHIPNEVKVTGVEISFSSENDNNIKQAEAYNKELDDLCNMLKKKQDKAKELLVKAVVNNNKLLLLKLNTSRLEEKIHATQVFFAGLTLDSVHG